MIVEDSLIDDVENENNQLSFLEENEHPKILSLKDLIDTKDFSITFDLYVYGRISSSDRERIKPVDPLRIFNLHDITAHDEYYLLNDKSSMDNKIFFKFRPIDASNPLRSDYGITLKVSEESLGKVVGISIKIEESFSYPSDGSETINFKKGVFKKFDQLKFLSIFVPYNFNINNENCIPSGVLEFNQNNNFVAFREGPTAKSIIGLDTLSDNCPLILFISSADNFEINNIVGLNSLEWLLLDRTYFKHLYENKELFKTSRLKEILLIYSNSNDGKSDGMIIDVIKEISQISEFEMYEDYSIGSYIRIYDRKFTQII
jgi:hypothetical protein